MAAKPKVRLLTFLRYGNLFCSILLLSIQVGWLNRADREQLATTGSGLFLFCLAILTAAAAVGLLIASRFKSVLSLLALAISLWFLAYLLPLMSLGS